MRDGRCCMHVVLLFCLGSILVCCPSFYGLVLVTQSFGNCTIVCCFHCSVCSVRYCMMMSSFS